MSSRKFLIIFNIILFFIGVDLLVVRTRIHKKAPQPITIQQPVRPVRPVEPPKPINYDIKNPVPSFLQYDALVSQLKEWEKEAPELVEVGTYGKTSKGTDLYFIRIRNERSDEAKPVVLLTGATHGNEPWSTTVMMACVGTMLDKYGDDEKLTALMNSRDIYVVPVVSPDTFGKERYVDGVDPNRDYPTQRAPDKVSVAPIEALKKLTLSIHPAAAISGHTFGRVYFYPYADSTRKTANDEDYRRILGKMKELSNYGFEQGCYNYGRPIFGSEMDWYYRNGCMGIVMEMGTHQRPPSTEEVRSEFERTFEAIKYFIEEAPKVQVQLYSIFDWRSAA